jgi:condensin complex subunit 3
MPVNTRLPALHAMHEQFFLSISLIFDQVQASQANHRKNFVTLYKAHMEAADYIEETPRGTRIVGEMQFQEAFSSSLLRTLSVKKGVTEADRVLKFIGGYVKFINEKGKNLIS